MMLIICNFNSNCLNPEEMKADLREIANKGEIIYILNDTFIPDRDGYLGEGNYAVVWKGINLINSEIIRD